MNFTTENNEEKIFTHKVQPYYSLRCIPQILGPVYDELLNAEKVLINEINSACDNPIVTPTRKTCIMAVTFTEITFLLKWIN